ncbi:MAG: exodeoxyribonuclease VII small subunit [Myxococcota bacterium]|jgi:exodeoxyribonuclease VII small subunit|nr:exodeoxyribonuclease VII small subunit [Myxococcota bacterium]
MSSLTPDPATAPPAFEEVLDRLDTIVQQLEGGGSSLEEALRLYEEGVRLSRLGTKALDEAERRIERQLEDGRREPLEVEVDGP